MWYSRISNFATSSISKRFTCKNHPTLNQKACFSSLLGLKSPSISSKNGYTNYSNNLYLVKHCHESCVHKWYKNLLKTTRNTYKYYQQTQKVISSPGVGFASLKRIIFPPFLFIAGLFIVEVYGRLSEKIPYTNRTHIVFAPPDIDKILGEFLFKKDELRLLSEEHPDSVRVKMIGEQIVEALESDLKDMKSENVSVAHLRGLDWEFVVVDEPMVNAKCLPGGKIIVYRGFLEQINSDAEIATIIGHEVGHIVARHTLNRVFKFMLLYRARNFLGLTKSEQKKVEVDRNPNGVSELIKVLFEYPWQRRNEREADYIGLLVMASAGNDPQEAPKVYEMLGKFSSTKSDFYLTHPSGKKRAKNLAKATVMEVASCIYSKAIETRKMNDLKDRWFWY